MWVYKHYAECQLTTALAKIVSTNDTWQQREISIHLDLFIWLIPLVILIGTMQM